MDCFSGPWNVRSEELSDSSFSIAIQELRKARETYLSRGHDIALRCFFIEKDLAAYQKLRQFANGIDDVEIETRNSLFEDAIPEILTFVKNGHGSFPFIFVDPMGWTGFPMDVIAPLLRLEPGEVLINFMTKDIRRFIESPQQETQESFARLFGSASIKDRLESLQGLDREDAAVSEYRARVVETGGFASSALAIVLHPQNNSTHFHLIYATRHDKGIEVFKDVERKAMAEMEEARANAQKRTRETKTAQVEMFGGEVLHDSSYYESLRNRYLAKSLESVRRHLRDNRRCSYDEAWIVALAQPLVWESDLKDWISARVKNGMLRIDGMTAKQRVPHRGKGNHLVWLAD